MNGHSSPAITVVKQLAMTDSGHDELQSQEPRHLVLSGACSVFHASTLRRFSAEFHFTKVAEITTR